MTTETPDQPDTPNGAWLSTEQAAAHLGISVRTVRRWIESGRLKGETAENSHALRVWIEGAVEPAPEKPTGQEQSERGSGGEGEATTEPTPMSPVIISPMTADTLYPLTDLISELTRKNAELAAVAAIWQERAKQLEAQLAAIPASTTPPAAPIEPKPWWKRLLGIA